MNEQDIILSMSGGLSTEEVRERLNKNQKRLGYKKEELDIALKAIGAYVGVLTSLLNEYVFTHPEDKEKLGAIIGEALARTTTQVL